MASFPVKIEVSFETIKKIARERLEELRAEYAAFPWWKKITKRWEYNCRMDYVKEILSWE